MLRRRRSPLTDAGGLRWIVLLLVLAALVAVGTFYVWAIDQARVDHCAVHCGSVLIP